MNLVSAVIPGLREVRAPLVAGYLWGVCIWLTFASLLPDSENPLYARLAQLGEAVGPVGLAVAASIAAYLAGSLFHSGFKFLFRRWAVHRQGTFDADERKEEAFREFAEADEPLSIENIVLVADPLGEGFSGQPTLVHSPLHLSVREIIERELSEAYRQVELAVLSVEERFGPEEVFLPFGVPSRTPVVGLPVRTEESTYAEFTIPHLLLSRDLFEQIPLLQTRLLEIAETTGHQVERLYAEADFRFAISPPIILLVLVLAIGANPLWLLALCIPGALVVQGVALMQKGAEELVDALRARIHTPEMQQITPVFGRYRALASHLVEGLRDADWRRNREA